MRVLIAVDDSPLSEAAAAEAAALFPDPTTEFYVLSVAEDPPPWVIDPLGISVPAAAGHLLHTYGLSSAEHAKSTAAEICERLPDASTLVAEGDAASEICRAAEHLDADVVVGGAVERGTLRRLIDPPVADDVAHRTRRPVLIIHGPAGRHVAPGPPIP